MLVVLLVLFSSCGYHTFSKQQYPFKTAKVSVNYFGQYYLTPVYFKPAFKKELMARVSDINFVSGSPDLCIKIDIKNVYLEPMGITYLDTHPTANTYILKLSLEYKFKTANDLFQGSLQRSRTFNSGLDLSHTASAGISKDYNFRSTMDSLAQDIARELVNRFLSRVNVSKVKEEVQ